jgi:hypothetical protein
MARRSFFALVAALGTAAMVGLSRATGLAPPPPLLSVESVEWLSPEPEDDGDPGLVFGDSEPYVPKGGPSAGMPVESRPRGWVSTLFGRWSSRRG